MRMWFKPVKVSGIRPSLSRRPVLSRVVALLYLCLLLLLVIPALPLLAYLIAVDSTDVKQLFRELGELALLIVSPWEQPDVD